MDKQDDAYRPVRLSAGLGRGDIRLRHTEHIEFAGQTAVTLCAYQCSGLGITSPQRLQVRASSLV